MIGRGDQHDVEVLFLEHLAVVGVRARLLLRCLPRRRHVGGVGEHPGVHVAQRHHLDRRDLDQAKQGRLAVPAAADQADAKRLGLGGVSGVAAEGGQGEAGDAGFEQFTAVHGKTLRCGDRSDFFI